MTRVVALTGGAASGKSTVARLFANWGAMVLSADAMVRDLQQPGQPVFETIVERFGGAIVAADGTLDRAALRQRVLDHPDDRRALEQIVHPAVEARRRDLIADAARRDVALVIVEIPLLFEAADPAAYQGVVLVDAPESVRRERLHAERGLDDGEIDRLFAAQLPASATRPRATWIIENDSDRTTLTERARAVWSALNS